jgi:hypothetical protein
MLRRSTSTPWRRIGSEVILAPRARDDFDQLSPTAAAVWSVLESPCSLEELVESLAEAYSVEPEEISPDVAALVSELLHRGVIEEMQERP